MYCIKLQFNKEPSLHLIYLLGYLIILTNMWNINSIFASKQIYSLFSRNLITCLHFQTQSAFNALHHHPTQLNFILKTFTHNPFFSPTHEYKNKLNAVNDSLRNNDTDNKKHSATRNNTVEEEEIKHKIFLPYTKDTIQRKISKTLKKTNILTILNTDRKMSNCLGHPNTKLPNKPRTFTKSPDPTTTGRTSVIPTRRSENTYETRVRSVKKRDNTYPVSKLFTLLDTIMHLSTGKPQPPSPTLQIKNLGKPQR